MKVDYEPNNKEDFLQFIFVARCEKFQEYFSAEAVDHSYDDVR
jgi:hypothetical protein